MAINDWKLQRARHDCGGKNLEVVPGAACLWREKNGSCQERGRKTLVLNEWNQFSLLLIFT